MSKLYCKILIFIIIIHADCYGQEADPGPGFQMIVMNNPAFSGSEGDGMLRLSYLNYYPGNNYNLHSVYCSYDSYFPGLHGGAGFYVSDDYQGGIINDFRGGVSYAYFLQADKDLYINGGLSASIHHRGFNFSNVLLPDQIDPLGGESLVSSEILSAKGQTVFDVGAGFLFIYKNFFGGLSINHLAEPDLSPTGLYKESLKREFLFHLSGDLNLSKALSLRIRPIAFMDLQEGFISGGLGTVFESNFLSINTIILADNDDNMNIQTGFSFQTGRVSFFYNYRFNIVSGNKLVPISLLHQTGLALSLNNVEKRNIIKTINFPKL